MHNNGNGNDNLMHNYVSLFIVATAFGDAATSEP